MMKQRFQIDGISCGGCIARVKKTLEAHQAVEKTEIFLNPIGLAIISMTEVLTVEDLQKQLNTLEGYTISELN